MFRIRKRRALPKKDMQVLSAITEHSLFEKEESEELNSMIKAALQKSKIVILKRHPKIKVEKFQVKIDLLKKNMIRYDIYHSTK